MFLTAHAAIGVAAATALTKDPAMGFVIGFLSHYFVDFVPHGDEIVDVWAKRGNELKRLFAIALVDGVIWAVVLVGVFWYAGFSWLILMAAVGSAVPDVMCGIEKATGGKAFGSHGRFHDRIHNGFDVCMPLWAGLLLQVTMTIILWTSVLS